MMDYKKIVDTALLAGDIMLESNAETYRVEDVMSRILHMSNLELTEAYALTTGLFATLDGPGITPISVVKRVRDRDTNLSRISNVNAVCRDFTSNRITLDEAYDRLKCIKKCIYRPVFTDLSITFTTASFAILFGGGLIEFIIAWFCGAILVLLSKIEDRINLGFFLKNLAFGAIISILTMFINKNIFAYNVDSVIAGAIMPLVPGTAVTNALRDTLRGDYISGNAKLLEALVIAISVAVGVALGLIFVGGVVL